MVLAIAVVVSTLVAVATFLQQPVYRATATIEIQPQTKSINPVADFSRLGVPSWSWGAEERYLNTQMQIIRSRETARATIERLGLEGNPRFAALKDPAAALAGRVHLEMLLDTYVLEVRIEDTDPQMAMLLANGIAQTYTDANVEAAIANARRVIDELYEQIEPLRRSIDEQEELRIQLARDKAFYVPETQESTLDSRLAQLQQALTEVEIARGEREAISKAIEKIQLEGGSYLTLPVVAENPLIRELNQEALRLEQQLQELSLSYREGHPRYMAARKARDEMPRKIEEQTEKIIAEIWTQESIDERRENDLREQLRRVREEGIDLSQTSSQIAMLDAEIQEQRRIYELITTRIKEIDLNRETLMNNVRMLEEAILPTHPVRPRKTLNLGAGILLGLLLGVGAVFFVDYLDNTIRSAEDIEQYLGLPLMAIVPNVQRGKPSVVKEAFQTLRTSVLFASKGRSLNSLLVTSAGPGEGKSLTAANLARTLASAGDRVALIDADLRRPTLHHQLDLTRDEGLTNFLVNGEGNATWLRYLKDASGVPNLKVLTSGLLPPNPVELFGTERFLEMLRELRQHFSWVVIDSPPVASVSDSVVLGSLADMTILVIKHNENDRDLIRNAVGQLRKVEAHVVGAVLNNVDLRRAGYYGYYATYDYESAGDHEGESRETKARLVKQEKTS
jgi:capsular exopolysaccharide synthesis family protein